MKPWKISSQPKAFTLMELVAVCAAVGLCAIVVLPALARTHNNSSLTQSMNNMRQLVNAWSMYPNQNGGRLVNSYPRWTGATNVNTWCAGNATSGGTAGSAYYGGADPTGILTGDLWPYIRNFGPYKCPADTRIAYAATNSYKNKPILRTYSINAYLAGETLGASPDVSIVSPANIDTTNWRLFMKDNQIARPSGIFAVIEEDPESVNDGMLVVSMLATAGFVDLPTRHHDNSYPLTFADGHLETYRFTQLQTINWATTNSAPKGGIADWGVLTNVTTVPNH